MNASEGGKVPTASGGIGESGNGAARARPDTFSAVRAARTLQEEIRAARWIYAQAAADEPIPHFEAQALIRSIHVTMHAHPGLLIPIIDLNDPASQTAAHAINVAVLAMVIAETLGKNEDDVRTIGLAGLLKDLGQTKVPAKLLAKRERFTAEEQATMQRHPVEGARMILEADESLELPAVVAYEHHLQSDGTGYPTLLFPRKTHYVSRLVRICDVFAALSTDRPQRGGRPFDEVLGHIEARAGTEFDASLVRTFTEAMRRLADRRHVIRSESDPLPISIDRPGDQAAKHDSTP